VTNPRPYAILGLAAVVLAVLVSVGLAGGDEDEPADLGEPVSLSAQVQPFLNFQCVACHLTGAESGGLNLEPGKTRDELLEESDGAPIPRVTPGDPEASYIVHKLRGTHLEVGGSGSLMPQGATSVSEELLALVERWVLQGALDN
jgi:mono/diheme cytochrome c family protein